MDAKMDMKSERARIADVLVLVARKGTRVGVGMGTRNHTTNRESTGEY